MKLVVPSIDILGGKAVRLRQGKKETAEVLGKPIELAAKYESLGFEWLHLVDLDAAFGGAWQVGLIEKIARREGKMKLQLSGGIRSCKAAESAIELGADRVVFGTALFEAVKEVKEAVAKLGAGRVWAGIDFSGKPPIARVRGWVKGTKLGMKDALRIASECGVGGVVISSIDSDGMQQGPDVALASRASEIYAGQIWLAGGMRNTGDAKAAFDAGAEGAIFGRALYDSKIDLRGLACLQNER